MRQIWNTGFDLPTVFSFYTALAGAVKKLLCRESGAQQGLVQGWHTGNGWKEWGCLILKKANFRCLKPVVEKERNDLFCVVDGVEAVDLLVQQGQFSSDTSRLLWPETADGDGECLSLEVTEAFPEHGVCFLGLGWTRQRSRNLLGDLSEALWHSLWLG